MIDQQLLAKLVAPNYGPALRGFSKHLIEPDMSQVVFYNPNRPYLPASAFNRYLETACPWPQPPRGFKLTRLCRISTCEEKARAQWETCGPAHSKLFWKEYAAYFWDSIRYNVAKRDGERCVICGNGRLEYLGPAPNYHPAVELQCDHIIPVAYVMERFADMPLLERIHRFIFNKENLRTLCQDCHKKVTKQFLQFWRPKVRAVALGQIAPITSFFVEKVSSE